MFLFVLHRFRIEYRYDINRVKIEERERERGLAMQTFSILVERRGMTAKAVSKQEALPLPILVLLVL